jgi:hypothetical protein
MNHGAPQFSLQGMKTLSARTVRPKAVRAGLHRLLSGLANGCGGAKPGPRIALCRQRQPADVLE